ncbi:hypothetical protein HN51_050236 [Arachis hypogaea]
MEHQDLVDKNEESVQSIKKVSNTEDRDKMNEVEVAEDDASLVKQIGQSFRYSKIESVLFLVNIHASSMYGRLNIDRIHFLIKARREEQI